MASPSSQVAVSDGISSTATFGRTDDERDKSLVFFKLAENTVLQGIGKFRKINEVTLRVALKEGTSAPKILLSKTWKFSHIIVCSSVRPLELVNVTFLVSVAELAAEELLVELPVLQHPGADSKNVLEEKRNVFDRTDCSTVGKATAVSCGGFLNSLTIARLGNTSFLFSDRY